MSCVRSASSAVEDIEIAGRPYDPVHAERIRAHECETDLLFVEARDEVDEVGRQRVVAFATGSRPHPRVRLFPETAGRPRPLDAMTYVAMGGRRR